ncbi:hypothetical protein BN79_017 [Yersinia phage phiR2-01]|uniref:Uncharacterized protein n=1 Tax=Yersinia phage phiR2-01 TaxID=1206557 RepID=I7KQR9_9CAUD|nr:hypothetical protein BN79_017 [Yersinia phage phiR2-01]CCI88445.1 hypothetical protein BN79_017 [Yersinia phage phiR2-01]
MYPLQVISAFPGTGKTHYTKCFPEVFDSDSSQFPKDNFPANYIEHIQSIIDQGKLILVSSHKEVRDALHEAGIDFLLLYPKRELKEEYLARYKERGSSEAFIALIDKNWDDWITSCECDDTIAIPMDSGEYITDIVSNTAPHT